MSEPTEADHPAVDPDDPREKFRLALERKRSKQTSNQAHADAGSKIHGEHASAATKRTFRRKSGG